MMTMKREPLADRSLLTYGNSKNPFIASCIFTGSRSTPDEDRLLRHLFDPDIQSHNLMTTPTVSDEGTVNVTVDIEIRKIIALVKSNIHFAYYLRRI